MSARAEHLRKLADLIEQRQHEADDKAAYDHGALTDAETDAHIAVHRMAKRLRQLADEPGKDTAGDAQPRGGESTQRTRVFTHSFRGEEPHLTITLAFGPQYTDAGTDAGVEEISQRVRAASWHGFKPVDEAGGDAP